MGHSPCAFEYRRHAELGVLPIPRFQSKRFVYGMIIKNTPAN
jgi:hypothetical protein